jgi:hypothetical protein
VSAAKLLKSLRGARAERGSLDRRELSLITGARALGATWHEVADALGVGGPVEACAYYEALDGRFAPPDLPGGADGGPVAG